MTAREKFTVNQTVVATALFFKKHRRYQVEGVTHLRGLVRGFSTTGQGVRVQIVGQTSVYRYPLGEWDPEGTS